MRLASRPPRGRTLRDGLRLACAALTAACAGAGFVACGGAGQIAQGSGGAGGFLTGAGGSTEPSSTRSVAASTVTSGAGGSGGSAGSGGGGAGGQKLGPPYPIVLAHGFFGFEKFAGLSFETYFYDVQQHLASQGVTVYTPAVDPFNTSDYRGAQLLGHVQEILAQTGAAKVNLIGHSQGGLDARVVADLRPDLVASVVTIAAPHHGTPIADIALKALANSQEQQVIDALVQLIGAPIWDQVGNSTSLFKPLYLFSQPGIAAFNAAHPDAPGVFYASIAGRTALHGVDADCQSALVIPFTAPFGSTYDPVNPLLGVTELVLEGGQGLTNDGLVRAKDAQWGQFWGCLPADHLDEIGQILGQGPGLGNGWKYLDFYSELVAYLRVLGY